MSGPDSRSYSLMLHGGAGTFADVSDTDIAGAWLDSIRAVLEHGRTLLAAGGSALDTVEACAGLLEDDPLFNAGRGAVLNAAGRVELDAAIMDGRDLSAGAVAAVDGIANPVSLARRVLDGSEHVLLVAEGAMLFADGCGLQRVPNDYATSSGGILNKHFGRVGDSPLVGAGVYADNETCAVSATGCGEDFMRTVFAKTIADFVFMQGMDASRATAAGIDYLVRKVNGRGGAIVIDSHGNCARGFTTVRMIHGWIEKGAATVCRF